MGYKLSVYGSNTFQEYLLPTVGNADYSVHLNRKIFPELADEELKMEAEFGRWRFLDTDRYQILYTNGKTEYTNAYLEDQSLLSITFQNGYMVTVQFIKTPAVFTAFSKYDIRAMERITVGRGEENDIVSTGSKLVKRQCHAILVRREGFWTVEDHSENGIFVNSVGINGSKQLEFGDCISIFGLCIVFLHDRIAVNDCLETVYIGTEHLRRSVNESDSGGETEPCRTEKIRFHRSPRQIYKIDDDPIEIEGPPPLRQESGRPALLTIGPSLTMAFPMLLGSGMAILSTRMNSGAGSAFMYTGLITAVSSALIGVCWAVANLRYEKKRCREEELHRFETYGEYLIQCSNRIKEKYDRNTEHMKKMYSPATDCCGYDENTVSLWNRNSSHGDYLTYRLGIGNVPFQAPIQVPKERFTMLNDSLSEKPMLIKKSFEILRDVPVCIDLLRHRLVGVIGGEGKQGGREVLYNLSVQAAVSNCYTDLKIIFIYDEKEEEAGAFRFAKWLPHVWSGDKKTRFVAGNKREANDVLYELTNILRIRMENAQTFGKKSIPKPYYLLMVANPELLEGELISSYIVKNEECIGLTTVLLVENYEELPNACDYVIENSAEFQGMYTVTDNLEERIPIRFDFVSESQLEYLSRTLAHIEVNEEEQGGEMPSALSFFEMYGIHHPSELHAETRWRKSRTCDSMKALIGQKGGGGACYLDVHEKYHGPHGLVAGTTGSGKSEILQTYLLSLAINFSPDDVGFFLIDYKGGGMANLFDGLPHVMGQISNLSGNQVHRAMVSIKSENRRRQRIFHEYGVNNINLYTRLFQNREAAEPVPHLFIVIDEFAELKREEPEFMKELISVAQVGRSLGVHLILATQKPGGTVDDNIWSNSKFRLCLRVQDRQDSNDMLHRPDAAYITQAGRCYLQVGNDELLELFQSGYSGAVYDEEVGEVRTDIARMVSTTGRAALIGNYLKMKRKNSARHNWIGSLLQVMETVLKSTSVRLEEVVSDRDLAGSFVKEVFTQFAKQGIGYPENEQNEKRLHTLLDIWGSVRREDEAADNLIREIIAYAEGHSLRLPEIKEKTQLNAVVEYLRTVAEENGYDHNLTLWLPVLPTKLYLNELEGWHCDFNGTDWGARSGAWSLQAPVGRYDDPVNQTQDTLIVNFARNGHYALTGMAGSGKSTFLQTLLYALTCNYTPAEVNLYILDFSSGLLDTFCGMPHVGGMIREGEDEKLSKFAVMVRRMIARRKELLKGGNYSQYVQKHKIALPAVLIVIDNCAGFRSKTQQKYDDLLLQLVKEGESCGMFLIITAGGFGSQEIPVRLGDNIRNVISLEMNDKFQYSEVLRRSRLDVLPEVNVKGRGLAGRGEDILEYQTAMAFKAEDDFRRMEHIGELAERMRKAWGGAGAQAIPEIPAKPVWSEFSQLAEVRRMAETPYFLPVGYNALDASVYGVDLREIYCYLILGKEKSGRKNFLKIVTQAAAMRQGKVTLIDFKGDLRSFAEKTGTDLIDTDRKLFDFFDRLTPDFISRNQLKKAAERDGLEHEEIYRQQLRWQAQFLLIANLADFLSHVEKPEEGIQSMSGFLANVLDKGALHNVFWLACHAREDYGRISNYDVYNLFIRDRRGIHFGGNVSKQDILDFGQLPFKEQEKSQKAGVGLLPANDESADRIVVPLYK